VSAQVPRRETRRLTRRDFGRAVAGLAAAPLAAGSVAGQGAVPAKAEDPTGETAKWLARIADLRYGKFLTDDQKKHVRRGIVGNLHAARALHRFKIKTEEEPAFLFRADLP
jgi:hypothetical protein